MTIAESLKRFRKTFNLSQKQVAETLGIKQPSYQVYESKTVPSATVVMKLADAYDVTTDYLLGRSDEPRPVHYDEKEIQEAFAFRDMWQSVVEKAVRSASPTAGQGTAQ